MKPGDLGVKTDMQMGNKPIDDRGFLLAIASCLSTKMLASLVERRKTSMTSINRVQPVKYSILSVYFGHGFIHGFNTTTNKLFLAPS